MNVKFFTIFIALTISILVSLVLSLLSFFLSYNEPSNENVSVYECGFDPFHSPGEPFSISFFVIGILFLIFDLEISYLIPWSANSNVVSLLGQLITSSFIVILVLGLVYEWINGGLEWE